MSETPSAPVRVARPERVALTRRIMSRLNSQQQSMEVAEHTDCFAVATGKLELDDADHFYEEELHRIQAELCKVQHRASFIPSLIPTQNVNSPVEKLLRAWKQVTKSAVMCLHYREIEKLDWALAKLWDLIIGEDARYMMTFEEYNDIMNTFNTMLRDALEGSCSTGEAQPTPAQPSPPTSSSEEFIAVLGERDGAAGTCSLGRGSSSSSSEPLKDHEEVKGAAAATTTTTTTTSNAAVVGEANSIHVGGPPRVHPAGCDSTPIKSALCLGPVPIPFLTTHFFLACPRVSPTQGVECAYIYNTYSQAISVVKTAAELSMWCHNGDGKLSEDELENYIRDLASRFPGLSTMPGELLSFYCCTATRRIFWGLDTSNRSFVSVEALLHSPIMDEWVEMQMGVGDSSRNWFGPLMTQHLFEKFLLLDIRQRGTLDAVCLHRYRKGLPTVLDDGLPADVGPLSSLFVDRYVELNVASAEMDFRKFVDFVLAVELLPQCSRPQLFWSILDLDGCGVLTPMTVNQFFRETHAKLVNAGLEVPTREVVMHEVFDIIHTAEPLRITRNEFIASPQNGLFVAIIVDCLSFWMKENTDHL